MINRGVPAWMLAWAELDARPDQTASCDKGGAAIAEVKIPELVQALTNLALGTVRRWEHE